jgi:hypothetical protein
MAFTPFVKVSAIQKVPTISYLGCPDLPKVAPSSAARLATVTRLFIIPVEYAIIIAFTISPHDVQKFTAKLMKIISLVREQKREPAGSLNYKHV